MADAINGKRNNPQTYMRQIQQEKAKYKRELAQAQREDMKAVRDHYSEQTKQLESEAKAAVVDIKDEARQLAAEQKRLSREQKNSARTNQDSEGSVEKKNFYKRPERTPLVQNYESRETDTFYRVQDRGSRLSEGAGYYIIDAYAPEHEKNNLRVSIQRDKAVISGQRKFADEASEEMRNIQTSNYQSFREEFKFDRPVSSEGMTRERIGDFVRFSIPKLEAIDDPSDQA